MKRFIAAVFVGAALVSTATVAQNYPSKPIRIVTGETGGAGDFMSRILAQGIAGPLGQSVIVENRGGGVVPQVIVSEATPDGYTLLVATNNVFYGPLLQKMPYDPVKDFAPISIMARTPLILAVSPALPVSSVKDLVALAKAKPGTLNYVSGGTGGSAHLAGELLKSLAHVDITRVAYKGTGTALADLVSGRVHITFDNASAVIPLDKAGKLKALAVTGAQPSALFPGLPTVAATLPGYDLVSMTAILAPAKTPAANIKRLNQEIVRFLATKEAKDKILISGSEAVGSSPEELATWIKTTTAVMGKVIKDAGIHVD